jgi:hypothetical protein
MWGGGGLLTCKCPCIVYTVLSCTWLICLAERKLEEHKLKNWHVSCIKMLQYSHYLIVTLVYVTGKVWTLGIVYNFFLGFSSFLKQQIKCRCYHSGGLSWNLELTFVYICVNCVFSWQQHGDVACIIINHLQFYLYTCPTVFHLWNS